VSLQPSDRSYAIQTKRRAEACKRDIPEAVVRFFDTGHFPLETRAGEIAATMREFLATKAL
jgi:hypothetical protein